MTESENAAVAADGTGLSSGPQLYSLFKISQDMVKLEVAGMEYLVNKAILTKYALYFEQNLREREVRGDTGTIQLLWENIDAETFALYLDLIYRHHLTQRQDSIEVTRAGDPPLKALSILAKVSRLCDYCQSHVIGSWVRKESMRCTDNASPRWDTPSNQEESHKWLQRAFIDWDDAYCKARIVTKFNKTVPPGVYVRLVPLMDRDFLNKVAIERDEIKSQLEKEQLYHKPPFGSPFAAPGSAFAILPHATSSSLFATPKAAPTAFSRNTMG
ncbi:hypothetical protein BJ170DRAFT_596784 [Xylariales sp. AK1849]|nr:hypothetical protein BJ170DRAFT_596784 [Xylariales sp. AK1849]